MEELTKYQYTDKLGYDEESTELWLTLFIIADKYSVELAHKLEYLRNSGTVLAPSRKFGYVLQPIIGDAGWASQADYDREKQCLNIHIQDLLKILKELANFDNDNYR